MVLAYRLEVSPLVMAGSKHGSTQADIVLERFYIGISRKREKCLA